RARSPPAPVKQKQACARPPNPKSKQIRLLSNPPVLHPSIPPPSSPLPRLVLPSDPPSELNPRSSAQPLKP
uniref:Uncharacterized protein n=1 Tax=Aegilops tauschii subsp. strangulata TaxID=200361 RepID=A0A453G0H4_AEGTS